MKLRTLACLSVLSMVGIAAAPAADAATLSPYVVTMSPPSSAMSLGSTMKVSGTVRGAGATRVTLYQLSGTRWVAWRSAVVVAGRYAVYYKPVSAGGHAIRVITGTTTKHRSGSSPTKTITVYKWHYLSDFANTPRVVVSDPWFWSLNGVASINGRTYLHTPKLGLSYVGASGYVEYNLSRACSTFRMTGGLTDESPTVGSAQLEVQTDSVPLWARTMTLGQSQAVSLSVRGSLRLRLDDTVVTADPKGHNILSAFGNAQVLCRF